MGLSQPQRRKWSSTGSSTHFGQPASPHRLESASCSNCSLANIARLRLWLMDEGYCSLFASDQTAIEPEAIRFIRLYSSGFLDSAFNQRWLALQSGRKNTICIDWNNLFGRPWNPGVQQNCATTGVRVPFGTF